MAKNVFEKINTNKKVRFPIQLKIFIANTIVLSFGMSLFLAYSFKTFIEDKEDSILSVSDNYVRSVENQINKRVINVKDQVNILSYILENNKNDFQQFFSSQTNISIFYHLTKIQSRAKSLQRNPDRSLIR